MLVDVVCVCASVRAKYCALTYEQLNTGKMYYTHPKSDTNVTYGAFLAICTRAKSSDSVDMQLIIASFCLTLRHSGSVSTGRPTEASSRVVVIAEA